MSNINRELAGVREHLASARRMLLLTAEVADEQMAESLREVVAMDIDEADRKVAYVTEMHS